MVPLRSQSGHGRAVAGNIHSRPDARGNQNQRGGKQDKNSFQVLKAHEYQD